MRCAETGLRARDPRRQLVWIAHLRGAWTPAAAKLEAALNHELILVGDLILLEVLQGARGEAHAARIERGLRRFDAVPLLDADLAPRAARNYRKLRDVGITIRKTNDIASNIAVHCCMTTAILGRWRSILGSSLREAGADSRIAAAGQMAICCRSTRQGRQIEIGGGRGRLGGG